MSVNTDLTPSTFEVMLKNTDVYASYDYINSFQSALSYDIKLKTEILNDLNTLTDLKELRVFRKVQEQSK